MRIWFGYEEETFPKKPTYFVEGRTVNAKKILKLIPFGSRLYLGAGKVECVNFDSVKQLLKNYKVAIETKSPELIPKELFIHCEVIFRSEIPTELLDLIPTFKIEDIKTILTIDKHNKIKLTRLSAKNFNPATKMYVGDMLIFDSKKKDKVSFLTRAKIAKRVNVSFKEDK